MKLMPTINYKKVKCAALGKAKLLHSHRFKPDKHFTLVECQSLELSSFLQKRILQFLYNTNGSKIKTTYAHNYVIQLKIVDASICIQNVPDLLAIYSEPANKAWKNAETQYTCNNLFFSE